MKFIFCEYDGMAYNLNYVPFIKVQQVEGTRDYKVLGLYVYGNSDDDTVTFDLALFIDNPKDKKSSAFDKAMDYVEKIVAKINAEGTENARHAMDKNPA